jgi:hypothetical protein
MRWRRGDGVGKREQVGSGFYPLAHVHSVEVEIERIFLLFERMVLLGLGERANGYAPHPA